MSEITEEWANTLSIKQRSEGDDIWVLGRSDVGAQPVTPTHAEQREE